MVAAATEAAAMEGNLGVGGGEEGGGADGDVVAAKAVAATLTAEGDWWWGQRRRRGRGRRRRRGWRRCTLYVSFKETAACLQISAFLMPGYDCSVV